MAFQKHYAMMRFFGLAGVSPRENAAAIKWGRRFEWPMFFAAIWILVDWYLVTKGSRSPLISFTTDWVIWLCFISELTILTALVDNRRRYLKQNWMSILIVVAGLPVLWGVETFYAGILRTLRLALMLGIFIRISQDARLLLSRHHLGTTLAISFVILLISGFLISGIDPAFESPLEGIWWAWVTVSTVGYGDIVPSTTEGRIFGSLLILMGVGLFSMLTASFSALFIEQDEREMVAKEERNIRRIEQLEKRLEKIEGQLERTLLALDRIEQHNHNGKPPLPDKAES